MQGLLKKLGEKLFGVSNPPPQTTEEAPVVGEHHRNAIDPPADFDPRHAWDREAERRRMRDMLNQNDAPSTTS